MFQNIKWFSYNLYLKKGDNDKQLTGTLIITQDRKAQKSMWTNIGQNWKIFFI